ncbi:hypothetical protein GM418_28120 [Maribellus comscasis]|uniref:Uncharacterized protein n=1 Tax=Maribellus comscasis TaxID=2681766 RepID=A0A6I6K6Y4_9BACT|nr:hypothetical protein [Maribellus comscasis]QGY47393.1 hypothetical protein GM418_28120 [Maribellus comscasis]
MLKTKAKHPGRMREANVRLRKTKSGYGMPLYHLETGLYHEEMLLYGSGTLNSPAKRYSTLYIGISQRYGAIRYGFT